MRIVFCSCSWTSADISKTFQGHLAELAEEKRWRQRARSASPSLPRSRRCGAQQHPRAQCSHAEALRTDTEAKARRFRSLLNCA